VLRELEAGPRQQTIDAARAEVRELQAQAELAELNYRRREQLLQGNAISREDYDSAALGLRSLLARLDAAERRLDELESGTRPEKIAAQQAVVAQLQAALRNIEVDLEDSVLKAPFSGTIGQRHLDEGAIVSPGAPLLRLVEDRHLEAWIGLPAQVASHFQAGESAEVVIEQTCHATRVKSILPELLAATRTRTVIFLLEDAARAFPGQIARIELEDASQTDGFWVPTSALARGSRGLWSVLVAEPTTSSDQLTAAKREVEVLHTDGPRTLVRGTLAAGDRENVGSAHRIVAGQLVRTADLARVR
jgi:RND family efflux transporter MFP subunit